MLNTHPQARPAQGPGLGHPKQRPRPHLRASRPGSAAHPASPAALVPARLQAPSCPHAVCLVTRGWLSTQGSAHRCPAGPSQPLPGCPGFAGLQAKGSRFCLPAQGTRSCHVAGAQHGARRAPPAQRANTGSRPGVPALAVLLCARHCSLGFACLNSPLPLGAGGLAPSHLGPSLQGTR